MVHALILSGGSGTRFGNDTPKQYIEVNHKPIIGYVLDIFQHHPFVDRITVVLSPEWQEYMEQYMLREEITKFSNFALSGKSRQHSILSGLNIINDTFGMSEGKVIIHDAARPLVSNAIIDNCIKTLDDYDMSMPVIPVRDTIYYTNDGCEISELLDRDRLFAGQAPEGCHLRSYLSINQQMSDEELSMTRGTSAAGYKYGLSVGLFPGEERNMKITVNDDLDKFRSLIMEQ